MYRITSVVETELASKYVKQLSHHFSHKVDVEKLEESSIIHFAMGQCYMTCEGAKLKFLCQAESKDKLDIIQSVIDRHIPILKKIKDIKLDWETLESND